MSRKNAPTESPDSDGLYRFEVFRFDASRDEPARFQVYQIEASDNSSVLEVLLRLQEEQDPSLAFRYACRAAVCGSCAMAVNGRLDLGLPGAAQESGGPQGGGRAAP